MKLGNMKSTEMAQFLVMMFTITQNERTQKLKYIASQKQEADKLRNEIAINEKILEDECANYMDEQEARSDLMYCNSTLERIEKILEETKDIQNKFNTIETLKSHYATTIQESRHKQIAQLTTKQDNLLSQFNTMCKTGITTTDFHACRKLFTQYNQTQTQLQKLKKQRIK